jgi:hypothetical protein
VTLGVWLKVALGEGDGLGVAVAVDEGDAVRLGLAEDEGEGVALAPPQAPTRRTLSMYNAPRGDVELLLKISVILLKGDATGRVPAVKSKFHVKVCSPATRAGLSLVMGWYQRPAPQVEQSATSSISAKVEPARRAGATYTSIFNWA